MALRILRTCLLALALIAAPEAVLARDLAPRDHALVVEAKELLAELDEQEAEYHTLRKQIRGLTGEERALLALQMTKLNFGFMRGMGKLVANVSELEEEGFDAAGYRQEARKRLWRLNRTIPEFIDRRRAEAVELSTRRDEGPEEDRPELEQRIMEIERLLDEIFRFYLSHVDHLEAMGLSSRATRAQAEERVSKRAENLTGRLELSRQRRNEAREESEAAPKDPALEAAVRQAQLRLERIAASLLTTCDVMDGFDLETSEHRQALITATGEITTDVLDVDVITGLVESGWLAARRWVQLRGPAILARIALFVAIMVVFWVAGIVTRRVLRRMLDRSSNVTELSRRLLVTGASRVVLGIGFFVALSQAGVNVTALLAGLGIAGFIAGFALQNTLGNFAAGAMILMYRPFDVGDIIEAGGVFGAVDRMNLVSTTFLTFDNQTLVVPNSKIWGDVIRNVTSQPIRRIDLSFLIAENVDIEKVEILFADLCREYPTVLDDPETLVRVDEVTPAGLRFIVRPWVKTRDYLTTRWDLTREAKLRLDAAGFPIATPRVMVNGRRAED